LAQVESRLQAARAKKLKIGPAWERGAGYFVE